MRKLSLRLIASHLLVAVLGALATFLVVRQLAPALFDETVRRAQATGTGRVPGQGLGPNSGLRDQFATAVDQALLLGALVGLAVAAVAGFLVARRVLAPLGRVQEATRRIATGDYATVVTPPRIEELAALATDVNLLGRALGDVETRRVRLLGEVAHELRTPLTVIEGYVEGMIDGVLPTDEASLALISEETRRLARLSDDLSMLSRAQEGRLVLRPVRGELREPVIAAAERLRPQAEDAGLTLRLLPGERALPVTADADRIAQVITNLVGNAIRASEPGGTVTLDCAAEGDRAVVRVSDTGEGLAPDDVERVFERFYRVPGRRGGGTDAGSGIGLTIARDLVRAHGGELRAASQGRGHGATFTLTLPLDA